MITTDWTLHNDIGPCPGDGIIIGADDVTLNLGGHRIFGNSDQGAAGESAGVHLQGITGAAVIGGQPGAVIAGFEAGVVVDGGSGNKVAHLTLEDNIGPTTDVAELGDGIVLFHSSDNMILDNVLSRNGRYDGIGVLGPGSDRNIIQRNVVEDSSSFGEVAPRGVLGIGIVMNATLGEGAEASLVGNSVTKNTVRRNQSAGISSLSSTETTIASNIIESNGWNGIGIAVNNLAEQNTQNVVKKNRVVGNNFHGIELVGNVSRPDGNRIEENTILDNAFSGIRLNSFADGNAILLNEVHGNREGIRLLTTNENSIIGNNAAFNDRTGPMLDLIDRRSDCGTNVWFGNTWAGIASPTCTQNGGTDLTPESMTFAMSQVVGEGDDASPSPPPVTRRRPSDW